VISKSFIFVKTSLLWAYDGSVHYKINKEAVLSSQLESILKINLNINAGSKEELTKGKDAKQIIDWIAFGGEAEDFGWYGKYDIPRSRAFNHFHDPLKSWDEAGLDDAFSLIYTANYFREPVSLILWGLYSGQQDFAMNLTKNWSWGKAREQFYIYLTGYDLIHQRYNKAQRGRAEGR